MKKTLFPEIENVIENFDFNTISSDRKTILQPLIDFIQNKVNQNKSVSLNFICTHNSRRSHLSQIWAQTAAAYYQIPSVYSYSGGTEATAMFPKVAETLQNQGFQIQQLSQEKNPVYAVKLGGSLHPVIGFSKRFDDDFNPQNGFAAIMTCSQADQGCPLVLGAEKRIPITYNDPKAFDGTPQQTEKYAERSLEIGTELCYVFSQIKK